MKQYKIVVLDLSDEEINKKAMQDELNKYTPLDENETDIYTFDSESDLDDVLDKFMWKYTDGGCDGDFVNSSLPVAVLCDNEFLGFFLLYQEVEVCNYNTKL